MINYKFKTELVPFGQEFERMGVSSLFHYSTIPVVSEANLSPFRGLTFLIDLIIVDF